MVGRNSPSWAEGAETAASADRLRERLLVLADEDVEVVAAVIAAVRDDRTNDGATDLVATLFRSSEVPLEIAEQAAEVAVLARVAAQEGKPAMRADAAAAAALAASATAVAVSIVNGNLAAPQLGESQRDVVRIREAAHLASERAGEGP
jgi:formiminotetrahydrofolate cyclodeaminase